MIAQTIGPEGFGNYKVEFTSGDVNLTPVERPSEVTLVPGFVDIHIHGAFGIDFMECSESDLSVLTRRLESCGYEMYLPTTVTASVSDVQKAIAKLPATMAFHLEGPFISPVFPGAQPPEFILPAPLGPSAWDPVLSDPRLRVVTLAPEIPHALELTARLSQRDVVVSMGHTNATYDEARFGFEFGARHTTHTFNAMRPLHHREAGMLGYALQQDTIACELIYDRKHVSREAAALLFKCKPLDKVIAVSDSTKATGLPSGQSITMWGHQCITGKDEVRLTSNGALAGSAITLLEAFQNLAEDFGVETAIRCCSLNPRKALGLSCQPKVYALFDKEHRLVEVRKLADNP